MGASLIRGEVGFVALEPEGCAVGSGVGDVGVCWERGESTVDGKFVTTFAWVTVGDISGWVLGLSLG